MKEYNIKLKDNAPWVELKVHSGRHIIKLRKHVFRPVIIDKEDLKNIQAIIDIKEDEQRQEKEKSKEVKVRVKIENKKELHNLTVRELKEMCNSKHIKFSGRPKKADLVALLDEKEDI